MSNSTEHVEALIKKAEADKNPLHAMQFTQAALNAAHALRILVDTREVLEHDQDRPTVA